MVPAAVHHVIAASLCIFSIVREGILVIKNNVVAFLKKNTQLQKKTIWSMISVNITVTVTVDFHPDIVIMMHSIRWQ